MSEHQNRLRVFLCHASEDREQIRVLYRRLVQAGVKPWMDDEDLLPGQDWEYEIRKAVKASHVCIVCLSQRSITKPGFVQKEIGFAVDIADRQPQGTIFLIPARFEDCDVPERLQRPHWFDLFDRGGFDEKGFGKLLRALKDRADGLGLTLNYQVILRPEPLRNEVVRDQEPKMDIVVPDLPQSQMTEMSMNEIRLEFAAGGDGIVVRRSAWIGKGVSQDDVSKPFTFALSSDDREHLRWYLEDFMDFPYGGSVARAERVQDRLVEWGRALFDHVLGDAWGRSSFQQLADSTAPRLLTIVSADAEVQRLPWELIAETRGPLAHRGIAVRRQIGEDASSVTPDSEPIGLPIRVLMVVSRPDDLPFIDPRHTSRIVFGALSSHADRVRVDMCRPATWEKVAAMLRSARNRNAPYHVLHFDGHGQAELVGAWLDFERPISGGKAARRRVFASELGRVLAEFRLPLVVLEACRTAHVGETTFEAIAPQLTVAGVHSVLAMGYTVHVDATQMLMEQFYRSLLDGRTIAQAVESAHAVLWENRERRTEPMPAASHIALTDWFAPQLYQAGKDRALIDVFQTAEGSTAVCDETPWTGERVVPQGFPPPPRHQFVGRARELHWLERLLLSSRTVVIHGMGGMGKSSLAREAAFWLAESGLFPEGACFISFEQPMSAGRIAGMLGAYLDGEAFQRLSEKDQMERASRLFEERAVLLVWDNFESILHTDSRQMPAGESPFLEDGERGRIFELVRQWTSSPDGRGRLLLTSRADPTDSTEMKRVERIELRGLARPDSLRLLFRVMEDRKVSLPKVSWTRDAVEQLLDILSDHPLSIELVAPHLHELPPDEITAKLREVPDQFRGDADMDRNRALLASLRFSTDRLSEEARHVLPWISLFRGGVFEFLWLFITQIDEGQWDVLRAELEAVALVRTEPEVQVNDRPYLRFHPTLPFASAITGQSLPSDAKSRFVDVYRAVTATVGKSFRGEAPRNAMELLAREEGNFRQAVSWAFELGNYTAVSAMGDVLREYLHRSGRRNERNAWVNWLVEKMRPVGFIRQTTERYFDQSWLLAAEGRVDEAAARLRDLIRELDQTRDFGTRFQLALATKTLGEVYSVHAGNPREAYPVLSDAVGRWERLVDEANANGESGEYERGNQATTLGSLANCLMDLARYDEALRVAKRGLRLLRELGNQHEFASSLAQLGQILAKLGRLDAAERLYDRALDAARKASDKELEAVILQNHAILADDRGHGERAALLAQQAYQRFLDASNEHGIMSTANVLGAIERKLNRFADSRIWFERSREIAERRGDPEATGMAEHNLALLLLEEAESARQAGDPSLARRKLLEARGTFESSLA